MEQAIADYHEYLDELTELIAGGPTDNLSAIIALMKYIQDHPILHVLKPVRESVKNVMTVVRASDQWPKLSQAMARFEIDVPALLALADS